MKEIKVTPDLVKQLESQGYSIKPRRNMVRKTFSIERAVLDAFVEKKNQRKMKMQDAHTEAIRDWVNKK